MLTIQQLIKKKKKIINIDYKKLKSPQKKGICIRIYKNIKVIIINSIFLIKKINILKKITVNIF